MKGKTPGKTPWRGGVPSEVWTKVGDYCRVAPLQDASDSGPVWTLGRLSPLCTFPARVACSSWQPGLSLQAHGSQLREGHAESGATRAGGERGFRAGLHTVAASGLQIGSASVPGGRRQQPQGLRAAQPPLKGPHHRIRLCA